jgi:hypothetical protein
MKGHSLPNNIPLPPDDDPFDTFIQCDLDLDALPVDQHPVFGETDDREALDEEENEIEPPPSSSRFYSPLPDPNHPSHPSRIDLCHSPSDGTALPPPSSPPLVDRQPFRWWREHFDGVFTLLIVVLLLAAWLGGKVEHQQTVDSLNATIAAQQTIIVQQQATLTAVGGGS